MPRERSIVIAFGRFNPPTTGHERLIAFLARTASSMGADARVYASPTTDAKKNPLPFQEKVGFLRQLFPQVTFNSNAAVNTPFAAYADASASGYKNITVIVGADRVRDFEKFGAYLLPAGSPKYNAAKHIDVSQYRVLAIPRGAGAMSATLMRGYVVANDFPSFLAGTPGQNTTVAKKIFTSLRRHMRIREQKAYREAMRQKVSEAQAVQVEGPIDTKWDKVDKRQRPPIPEHPFHKLDNAKLGYIQKDAALAAKAMQGHDRKAEAKYLDQVNDVTTILHYRRRGGKQLKEAVTKLGRGASVGQQMQAALIIYKSLTGRAASARISYDGSKPEGAQRMPLDVINEAVRYFMKGRHTPEAWHIAGKMLNKATELGIKWDQKLIKPTTRKAMHMDEAAGMAAPKPPSEVDRLKVRQTTDLITLKQRQATELMAAKIRDVETKAREAQTKATAPKGAAVSAS